VEGVEGEGGLSGAGQAGQDDQLVLGEGEGDVLQIVETGTRDVNGVVHGFKSFIEVLVGTFAVERRQEVA
jgi:hypothetical protein